MISERQLEACKKRHGSEDYRRAEGVMRDVLVKAVNENYEEQLQGLKVPVDFVWGGSDSVVRSPKQPSRSSWSATIWPASTSLRALAI